jgi:hypothetical protein
MDTENIFAIFREPILGPLRLESVRRAIDDAGCNVD